MTKDEFRDYVDSLYSQDEISYNVYSRLVDGVDTLEQDTVSFDFELYEAGMMSMPKEMIKVLDKIRAEINQITDTMGVSYNQYVSKIDVLKIIDKYRESEVSEC